MATMNEFYKTWADSQTAMMNSIMTGVSNAVTNSSKAANTYGSQLVEQANEAFSTMADQTSATAKKAKSQKESQKESKDAKDAKTSASATNPLNAFTEMTNTLGTFNQAVNQSMSDSMASLNSSAHAFGKPYQALLDAHMSLMQQWMESTMNTAEAARKLASGKTANDGDAVLDVYEQWTKNQSAAAKRWADTTKKSQAFFVDATNASATGADALNNLLKLYGSWQSLTNAMSGMASGMANGMTSGMASGNPVTWQNWQPFFSADPAVNPALKAMMNPTEGFATGFATNPMMQTLNALNTNLASLMNPFANKFANPFGASFPSAFPSAFPSPFGTSPNAFFNFVNSFGKSGGNGANAWMPSAITEFPLVKMTIAFNESLAALTSSMQSSMQESMKTMMDDAGTGFDAKAMSAEFTRLMESATKMVFGSPNAYMTMMEQWAPLMRVMQESPMDAEKISQTARDIFAPEHYKAVLDNMFSFDGQEGFQRYAADLQAFAQQFTGAAQHSLQTASTHAMAMFEQNMTTLNGSMNKTFATLLRDFSAYSEEHGMEGMSADAAMKLYNSMMTNYRKAFDMMLETSGVQMSDSLKAMMGVKEDTAMTDLAALLLEQTMNYTKSVAQFQLSVYTTGQQTMEQVLDLTKTTAENAENFKNFDTFFEAWSDANTNAYKILFNSKDFTAKQKDLARAANDIRATYQSMIEHSLQDYPVVLRSEITELRDTVKQLQAQLQTRNETSAAKSATSATTATEAKKTSTTSTVSAARSVKVK
jgi:hypothetical protein